jgi:hypothetical protein
MKDFERYDQDLSRPEVEESIKQKKEIQYKFIDRIKPHEGHRVWEVDLKTKEVSLAEYVEHHTINWSDAVKMFYNPEHLKEIRVKKGKAYIAALNQESALDRFYKNKGSATIPKGTHSL